MNVSPTINLYRRSQHRRAVLYSGRQLVAVRRGKGEGQKAGATHIIAYRTHGIMLTVDVTTII